MLTCPELLCHHISPCHSAHTGTATEGPTTVRCRQSWQVLTASSKSAASYYQSFINPMAELRTNMIKAIRSVSRLWTVTSMCDVRRYDTFDPVLM